MRMKKYLEALNGNKQKSIVDLNFTHILIKKSSSVKTSSEKTTFLGYVAAALNVTLTTNTQLGINLIKKIYALKSFILQLNN